MRTCFGQAASSPHAAQSPEPRPAHSAGPCGWDRANTSTDQQAHSWDCCSTPRSADSRPSYESEIKDQLISHLLPLGSSVATGALSRERPCRMQARLCYSWHRDTCLCTAVSKRQRPSSGKAEAAAALSILFLSGNTVRVSPAAL